MLKKVIEAAKNLKSIYKEAYRRELSKRATVGLTTSDVVITQAEYKETVEQCNHAKGKYILKTSTKLHFALIDITYDSDTKLPQYTIECIETNDRFKLSKNLFGLLFEREFQKITKNIF